MPPPEHLQLVQDLLSTVGKVVRVPEAQQDAVTALSGSGPAYFFFLVEAMIDAGILLGLPRAVSAELIIQSAVGAATMLRDSGEHPTMLREAVTSPGGTTIAAIRELENHGGAGRAAVRHRGGRGAVGRAGQGARAELSWDCVHGLSVVHDDLRVPIAGYRRWHRAQLLTLEAM